MEKTLNPKINIYLARFQRRKRNELLADLINYVQDDGADFLFIVRNDKIIIGEKEFNFIKNEVELVIKKQVYGRHISDYTQEELDQMFDKFFKTRLITVK